MIADLRRVSSSRCEHELVVEAIESETSPTKNSHFYRVLYKNIIMDLPTNGFPVPLENVIG